MAPNSARIAFFKTGLFSHINPQIEGILRAKFPDYPLDVFDVDELLKPQNQLLFANLFSLLKDYHYRLIFPKQPLHKQFYRTSYLFRQIKRLATERLRAKPYLFSFQTQSLFDASVPGIPHFVYTDHSILANLAYPGVTHAHINALYPPALLALEEEIYQNAERIFTMSGFVAQNLIDHYNCRNGRIICVGGGSNTYARESDSTGNFAEQNILFVGVDWVRKGGPDLVQAFQRLRTMHPEATLTIVGSAPKITLPNCHVIGPVPPMAVQAYFDNASIFCLPSKREPFGIALIEASLAQLPVVSTTVGAIPGIIRHNESGILVPPGDVDGLVNALDRLLRSAELSQQMGQAGRRHIEENFTWEIVGDKIAQHIRESVYPDYAS